MKQICATQTHLSINFTFGRKNRDLTIRNLSFDMHNTRETSHADKIALVFYICFKLLIQFALSAYYSNIDTAKGCIISSFCPLLSTELWQLSILSLHTLHNCENILSSDLMYKSLHMLGLSSSYSREISWIISNHISPFQHKGKQKN